MALGDIYLCLAWQVRPLVTSTFISRGSFTHNFVTHHLVTHHLSPTIFVTIFHTPSFTHHFVTHHLLHTTLSHTIFHTQLCHTPSLSRGHHLSHTMAPRHFAWQAWHLETSTCVWRGRRGACCTWWRAWSPLVARGTAPLCVAGVALGDMHLHFTWQAWHWRTWSPLVARSATPLCHNFVTRSLSHTTFTHNFHTHHLSHTTLSHTHHLSLSHNIFHIRLCHTHTHTPFFLLVDPPPPPLSFLPSPSPLQHVWITIGRS